MEQCGSFKKRGVVSEDRISKLPEALTLQILSLLPTKHVITTSVLSKQWRYLWKLVPKLEFESYGPSKHKFEDNVGRSLLLHKAPFIESLHIRVRDRCDDIYIGIWAAIAFIRHVREFELDLRFMYGNRVRFPSSLFRSDTLEILKLKNFILLDFPSPGSMMSLRTLHLKYVVYKDDDSVQNLFSSCPNLEHLVVCRCLPRRKVGVNFIIEAPSLKTLSIYHESIVVENVGYVVNAPSLKCLKIKRLQGSDFCLIENASELVEADIRNVCNVGNEKILGSLKSAKRLSLALSPLEISYPSGVIFNQLVYLEMYTHKADWWNLLTLMLDSSPKLQVLKLIGDFEKVFVVGGKWNQPKYVPECLLSHLETFVWKRYDWEREEEIEVASYILSNARRLKKATFSTGPIGNKEKLAMMLKDGVVMASNSCHIESKEINMSEERSKMLNELASVVKASDSCHLVFECE